MSNPKRYADLLIRKEDISQGLQMPEGSFKLVQPHFKPHFVPHLQRKKKNTEVQIHAKLEISHPENESENKENPTKIDEQKKADIIKNKADGNILFASEKDAKKVIRKYNHSKEFRKIYDKRKSEAEFYGTTYTYREDPTGYLLKRGGRTKRTSDKNVDILFTEGIELEVVKATPLLYKRPYTKEYGTDASGAPKSFPVDYTLEVETKRFVYDNGNPILFDAHTYPDDLWIEALDDKGKILGTGFYASVVDPESFTGESEYMGSAPWSNMVITPTPVAVSPNETNVNFALPLGTVKLRFRVKSKPMRFKNDESPHKVQETRWSLKFTKWRWSLKDPDK